MGTSMAKTQRRPLDPETGIGWPKLTSTAGVEAAVSRTYLSEGKETLMNYNLTIFIEEAETKKRSEDSLIIQSKHSWALPDNDQSPSSFWITHPDNVFVGSHAAGPDRYGLGFET